MLSIEFYLIQHRDIFIYSWEPWQLCGSTITPQLLNAVHASCREHLNSDHKRSLCDKLQTNSRLNANVRRTMNTLCERSKLQFVVCLIKYIQLAHTELITGLGKLLHLTLSAFASPVARSFWPGNNKQGRLHGQRFMHIWLSVTSKDPIPNWVILLGRLFIRFLSVAVGSSVHLSTRALMRSDSDVAPVHPKGVPFNLEFCSGHTSLHYFGKPYLHGAHFVIRGTNMLEQIQRFFF